MLNTPENAIASVFQQVLILSGAASVAAVSILLLRLLIRDRLSPRWSYLLWSLLVIRLVLPVTPESPISIYNWMPTISNERAQNKPSEIDDPIGFSEAAVMPKETKIQPNASMLTETAQRGLSESTIAANRSAADQTSHANDQQKEPSSQSAFSFPAIEQQTASSDKSHDFAARLWTISAWIWLIGLVGALVLGIKLHLSFLSKLRHDSAPVPIKTEQVLSSCMDELRLRRKVRLFVTGQVTTPTLLGVFRPRLLLPSGVLTQLDESQLRHILLHELAHIKRLDIAVNVLASLLTAIHWFNPLLAYAFRRMREDQEVACDERAMRRFGTQERIAYGRTLLTLLDSTADAVKLPLTTGIIGSRSEIRRRLNVIARPSTRPVRSAVLGLTAMAVLGGCTLTEANSTEPEKETNGLEKAVENNASNMSRPFSAAAQDGGKTEKTLLVDEKNVRITSLGVSSTGMEHEIEVEVSPQGWKSYNNSYTWRTFVDPASPPLVDWVDVNDDGTRELVIQMNVYTEGDMTLKDIHVLNPNTLQELEVADYLDFENNTYTVGPVRTYGGRVFVNAGLNGTYIGRSYDDEDREDWSPQVNYFGVSEYEFLNGRIVAHAYGSISDHVFPVKLTVAYGPDLKPEHTSFYPTRDEGPLYSETQVRERIDEQMGTFLWEMKKQNESYLLSWMLNPSSHSRSLIYGVNPETGTIFSAMIGEPLGTIDRSADQVQAPDLSDLYDEAYENKVQELMQPIFIASRLKPSETGWFAGYAKDGYVLANVIRGERPVTIKADLFTGMWEEVAPQTSS